MNLKCKMQVTVNHIANSIKDWCSDNAHKFNEYRDLKGGWKSQAANDITQYFNANNCNHDLQEHKIYNSSEENCLLFNSKSEDASNKIIAEITCESIENSSFYSKHIDDHIERLTNQNLKQEYKDSTKCIISLYFNLRNREYLHKINFIEVFNNLEIGCAIKRLR